MISLSSSSKPTSRILSASSMIRHWRFLNMNPGVFCGKKERGQVYCTDPCGQSVHCKMSNLQVIEKSARCSNHDIDSICEFLGFSRTIAASHDEAVRVHVMRHQLLQHTICLHSQLTSGRQNDHSSPWETDHRFEWHLYKEKSEKANIFSVHSPFLGMNLSL